jgi:hypothetical protein
MAPKGFAKFSELLRVLQAMLELKGTADGGGR